MDNEENNMSILHQSMSQHNRSKHVNIDDLPIPTTKAKTFEELLESNL